MLHYLIYLASALPSALALECAPSAFQTHLPSHAQITSALRVPKGGTFNVTNNLAYPASPTNLRGLCAIEVNVASSPSSSYTFGLFLPDEWNERFLAVGNSGYSGGINWIDMGNGVGYGFAVVSTGTGHSSSLVDGTWAYQSEESRIDWGYRSLHGSTAIAKDLVSAFYGQRAKWNYLSGCSTGGRQGLKEAQLYPDDFDGILAGSAAWWTTHLSTWTVRLALNNLPQEAEHHIPASLFPIIEAEVIRQCDGLDGARDGIITYPDSCSFYPEALLCGPNVANQSECLTAPQIDTLYKIYGTYYDVNQTFIFPGEGLGTEAQWLPKLGEPEPSRLGIDYLRYFLDLGADWDYNQYGNSLVQLADRTDPGDATADDYDLGPFQKKGGKLMTYHGLADGNIPAHSSQYFYKSVAKALVPQGIELDSFYRHFEVPGLQHCVGTPERAGAPWYIAGANQAAVLGTDVYSVPGFEDAEHDALLALMKWTEEGAAPERIVGTKWVNDTLRDEVLRQRPLCVYAKVAVYDGQGDADRPESWECKERWDV